MRLSVFFVCLCFLLLKGYGYIYAGVHHNNIHHFSGQPTAKKQPVKIKTGHQHRLLISDADLYANNESPVIEESEDDNNNNILVRKDRLLANCALTLSGLSILNYFHSRFTVSEPFCGYLSDKYITQRVLRV